MEMFEDDDALPKGEIIGDETVDDLELDRDVDF